MDGDNEPLMPTRSTSSFLSMVSRSIRHRATSYTLFVAGQGGDAALIQSYLDAIAVFESHLREWAGNHSSSAIRSRLPHFDSLVPPVAFASSKEPDTTLPEAPPLITLVCTLALQEKLRAAGGPPIPDLSTDEAVDGVIDTLTLWNRNFNPPPRKR